MLPFPWREKSKPIRICARARATGVATKAACAAACLAFLVALVPRQPIPSDGKFFRPTLRAFACARHPSYSR
jgi:hypothetical protein